MSEDVGVYAFTDSDGALDFLRHHGSCTCKVPTQWVARDEDTSQYFFYDPSPSEQSSMPVGTSPDSGEEEAEASTTVGETGAFMHPPPGKYYQYMDGQYGEQEEQELEDSGTDFKAHNERARDCAIDAAIGSMHKWEVCTICVKRLASLSAFNKLRVGEDEAEGNKDPWALHTTFWDLYTAGSQGCKLCKAMCFLLMERFAADAQAQELSVGREMSTFFELISDNKSPSYVPSAFSKVHVNLKSKTPTDAAWLYIVAEVRHTQQAPYTIEDTGSNILSILPLDQKLVFVAYPSASTDTSARYLPHLVPSFDPSRSEAFGMALDCLQKCEAECEGCTRKLPDAVEEPPRQLPSRLIEVILSEDGQCVETARLIEPCVDIEYTTLSYCWGDPDQPHATTKINLTDRQKGFPIFGLPQTFIDAFIVIVTLGYRFIWIDALCIVQDSRIDKQAEIQRMRAIFEGSFLTIVAASASAASQGFLDPVKPARSSDSFRAPFWDRSGQVGSMDLMPRPSRIQKPARDPVHNRGWTLEEFMLSSRRLCYTSGQLVWKCNGFERYDGGWDYPGMFDDRILEALNGGSSEHGVANGTFLGRWGDILEEYTSRHLTDQRDRLTAIGGIVQLLERQHRFTYHNGLWKELILNSLRWYVRLKGALMQSKKWTLEAVERRSEIDCPSWSWGSLNCPVTVQIWRIAAVELSLVIVGMDDAEPNELKMIGHLVDISRERTPSGHVYFAKPQPESEIAFKLDIGWDTADAMNMDPSQLRFLPLAMPGFKDTSITDGPPMCPRFYVCGLLLAEHASRHLALRRVGYVFHCHMNPMAALKRPRAAFFLV